VDLRYMISADFGQINDYTAVAVMERCLVEVGEPYQFIGGQHLPPRRRIYETRRNFEQHYDLIRLDRVPLNAWCEL
jgi:phage terminase large subunit-like protein